MRLIDADALMKIVDAEMDRVEEEILDAKEKPTLYTDDFRKFKSYTAVGMAHIAQDIFEAPTIDAEPVVRCKDCKFHGVEESMGEQKPKLYLHYCEDTNRIVEPTCFCSFGERENNEID